MTVAEYVAAFISIMIGLALADLATSLQRLLRAGKRVRWDLLTPAAAVLVTAFIINVWWVTFGTLTAMRSLSVGGFIPDLIALLLLFSLASSALPDAVGETMDLGQYYQDNRKWFWGLFTLYTIWVTLSAGVRASSAGTSAGGLLGMVVPNLVLAALMLVLVATARRWVHTVVIALLLVTTGFAWLPQELGRAS